jgi:hypothetical protein
MCVYLACLDGMPQFVIGSNDFSTSFFGCCCSAMDGDLLAIQKANDVMLHPSDVSKGIPMIIAIAVHNIPEGISVAAPIYHSTKRYGTACRAACGRFWRLPLTACPCHLCCLIHFLVLLFFLLFEVGRGGGEGMLF